MKSRCKNGGEYLKRFKKHYKSFKKTLEKPYDGAKENNTLVSGNADDEKNLRPGGRKKFFYQFN